MANKDILGFGKDINDLAKPLGISGEENDKLITISLNNMVMLQKILKELKKFNIHLDTITNTKMTYEDAKSYKRRI